MWVPQIKFKKLNPKAVIPSYATEGSAGFDFVSIEEVVIEPNQRWMVSTGLSCEFSKDYEIQVRPRSGLAAKHGVTVLNSPGTIDSDFRGEIKVILVNHGVNPFKINVGDRIAQGIFNIIEKADIVEVQELSETMRGEGGFGSTGN